jgi:hypothetical protein
MRILVGITAPRVESEGHSAKQNGAIGVCKNGPWDSLGTIAKGHGSEWIGAELAKIIALEKLSVG